MADPVRITVIFDAQGQLSLQRGAESLGAVQQRLAALSAQAGNQGRVLRAVENDINRFSAAMRSRMGGSLDFTSSMFERFHAFAGRLARIGLYTAIAQIGALTAGVYSLGKAFMDVNERFGELEVMLKSVYGSVTIARQIRDEIAKIAVTSPLRFQDISETVRSFAAMPSLSARIGQEAWSGGGESTSFLRKMTQLVEQMVTFRPDKTAMDATFAIREAVTGELRSLIRRFEFPPALLVAASGKPINELKRNPDMMLEAIKAAFDRIITPSAVQEMARQPRFLFSRLIEQVVEVPMLKIGRSGESQKTDFYTKFITFFYNILESSSSYIQERFSPTAKRLSEQLNKAFDTVIQVFDDASEQVLSLFNLGKADYPGIDRFQRIFIGMENVLSKALEYFPVIAEKVKSFITTIIPPLQNLVKLLGMLATAFKNLFAISPWAGLAGLFALNSAPTLFRSGAGAAGNRFIAGATSARAAFANVAIQEGIRQGGFNLTRMGAVGAAGAAANAAGGFVNSNTITGLQTGGIPIRPPGAGGTPAGLISTMQNMFTAFSRRLGVSVNAPTATGGTVATGPVTPQVIRLARQLWQQDLMRAGYMRSTPGSTTFVNPSRGPGSAISTRPANAIPINFYQQAANQAGLSSPMNVARAGFAGINGISLNRNGGPPPINPFLSAYNGMRGAGGGVISSALGAGAGAVVRALTGSGTAGGLAAGAVGATAAGIGAAVMPVVGFLLSSVAFSMIMNAVDGWISRKNVKSANAITKKNEALSPDVVAASDRSLQAMGAYFEGLSGEFYKQQEARPLSGINPPTIKLDLPAVTEIKGGEKELINTLFQKVGAPSRIRADAAPITEPFTVATPVEKTLQQQMAGVSTSEYVLQQVAPLLKGTNVAVTEVNSFIRSLSSDREKLLTALNATKLGQQYTPVTLDTFKSVNEYGGVSGLDITTVENANIMFAYLTALGEKWMQSSEQFAKTPEGQKADLSVPLSILQDQFLNNIKRSVEEIKKSPYAVVEQGSMPGYEQITAGLVNFRSGNELAKEVDAAQTRLSEIEREINPFTGLNKITSLPKEANRVSQLQNLVSTVEGRSIAEDALNIQVNFSVEAEKLLKEYLQTGNKGVKESLDFFYSNVLRVATPDSQVARTNIDLMGVSPGLQKYFLDLENTLVKQMPVVKEINKPRELAQQVKETTLVKGRGAIAEDSDRAFEVLTLHISEEMSKVINGTVTSNARVADNISESISMLKNVYKLDNFSSVFEDLQNIVRGIREIPDIQTVNPELRDYAILEQQQSQITNMTDFMQNISESRTAAIKQLDDSYASGEANIDEATYNARRADLMSRFESLSTTVGRLADKFKIASEQLSSNLSSFISLIEATGNRLSGVVSMQGEGSAATFLRSRELSRVTDNERQIQKQLIDALGPQGANFFNSVSDTQSEILGKNPMDYRRSDSVYYSQLSVIQENYKHNFEGLQRAINSGEITNTDAYNKVRAAAEEYAKSLVALDKTMRDAAVTVPTLISGISDFMSSRRGYGEVSEYSTRYRMMQQREKYTTFNEQSSKKYGLKLEELDYTKLRRNPSYTYSPYSTELEQQRYLQSYAERQFQITQGRLASPQGLTSEQIKDLEAQAAAFSDMAAAAQEAATALTGYGDAAQSFARGFTSVMDEMKVKWQDFSQVGEEIARSTTDGLGNALGDIVMKAKSAGEAFRDFGRSLVETAARALMNKMVQSLIGMVFSAIGGPGGMIGGIIAGGMSGGASPYSGGSGALTVNSGAQGMPMMSDGGLIPGVPSRADNRLAMVATGEYIIPTHIVQKWGPQHFDVYRKGGTPTLPVKISPRGATKAANTTPSIDSRQFVPIKQYNEGGLVDNSVVESINHYNKGGIVNNTTINRVRHYVEGGLVINDNSETNNDNRSNRRISTSRIEHYSMGGLVKNRTKNNTTISRFAEGGYVSRIANYASGGIVAPILSFAGGGYVDTKKPVIVNGSGAVTNNIPVSVSVNVNQNGTVESKSETKPEEMEARGMALARGVQVLVQQEITRQMRQGGAFRQR